MKTYTYSLLAILVALLLSLNTIKLFPLDEMSLFLTVIGLIYGLTAAFTTNNAWERFSKIRDGIAEETNSLILIHFLAKKLSDRATFKKLKAKTMDYCESVLKTEWHAYWKCKEVHRKFRELIEICSGAKLKNKKDMALFEKIIDELRDATSARNIQLVLSQTRISNIQWALNIFLSIILIIGLIFTYLPDYKLSLFIVFSMIASVLMILVVMYELDSMRVAEEEVSNEPYRQVIRIIHADIVNNCKY